MTMVFTPTPDHAKAVRSIGDLYILVGTIAFGGSYATGGEVPAISTGGTGLKSLFKQIGVGEVIAVLSSIRGNAGEYDNVADKLKLFSSAGTELAAGAHAAALTASPVQVALLGR